MTWGDEHWAVFCPNGGGEGGLRAAFFVQLRYFVSSFLLVLSSCNINVVLWCMSRIEDSHGRHYAALSRQKKHIIHIPQCNRKAKPQCDFTYSLNIALFWAPSLKKRKKKVKSRLQHLKRCSVALSDDIHDGFPGHGNHMFGVHLYGEASLPRVVLQTKSCASDPSLTSARSYAADWWGPWY